MHTNPEVLALLALGEDSATATERDHVASCPTCTQEVAELAHLAGVGRAVRGAAPLESPRPEVWDRIRAEIGFDTMNGVASPKATTPSTAPPISPSTAPSIDPELSDGARPADAAEPSRRTPRGRRILALALAAAIALILGVGIGLGWSQLSRPTPTVVAEANLTPPLAAWEGSTGEALLEQDATGKEILVVRLSTPRPVTGELVVWAMNDDASEMQPVGRLTGAEGEWSVSRDLVTRYPVVDVSDEPLDGNPTHSGQSIVRGTLDL